MVVDDFCGNHSTEPAGQACTCAARKKCSNSEEMQLMQPIHFNHFLLSAPRVGRAGTFTANILQSRWKHGCHGTWKDFEPLRVSFARRRLLQNADKVTRARKA